MPKMSTNDLIDTISKVIEEHDFGQYGDDDLAYAIRGMEADWVTNLAREIARVVR